MGKREGNYRAPTGKVSGGRKPAAKREDVEATIELGEESATAVLSARSLAQKFAEVAAGFDDDVIDPLRECEVGENAVEILEILPLVSKNLAAEFSRLQDEGGDGEVPQVDTGDPLEIGAALLSCSANVRKSLEDAPRDIVEAVDQGIDSLRAFLSLPDQLDGEDHAAEFFTKADRIPKPFRSPGGKAQLVNVLLSRVPEHKVYVEPYAGSATLFWAKKKVEKEVLSDLNEGVVGLFKFLQEAGEADFEWMRKQIWGYDAVNFNKLKEKESGSARYKAYRFKYLNLYSMRGRGETIDDSPRSRGQTGALFLRNLERYKERLENVRVIHGDALEVMKKYDRSGVFMYIDPPWRPEQGSPEWKAYDHEAFEKAVSGLKANALVSYQGKLVLGDGWRKHKHTSVLGGISKETTQSLYWNYNFRGVEAKREGTSGCEFCDALAAEAFVWDGGIIKSCHEHESQARELIENVNKSEVLAVRDCELPEQEEVAKLSIDEMNPRSLREVSDRELLSLNRRLHQLYGKNFEGNDKITSGDLNREDLVNAYIFVSNEMKTREMELNDTSLAIEARTLAKEEGKKELAPVLPGSSGAHPLIKIEEVLPHFKSFKIRMPFLWLVGSLANMGKTENDIDLLVKGPCSEELLQVLKFRLGRMLPPELSKRLSVMEDELGGPFTSHVELADLVVEMRPAFAVKEMALAKQDDPLLDLPKEAGKKKAVFQYHARGSSLHLDLRMELADFLVGWTMANQRSGKVPVIETMDELKRIGSSFSPDGDQYTKPFRSPARLAAFPKSRQPEVWLGISARRFEPGEVGASRNEYGVIVAVDRPSVEYGTQSSRFHEYFFTGKDAAVQGILAFRQLVGRGKAIKLEGEGGDPFEEGRRTPAGRTFWTSMLTSSALPSVLKRRAVHEGRMPPDGKSAIPISLERVTPKEFRYWEAKGKEAREIRDALVSSRFFTEQNVGIVDGEFRRLVQKTYLYTGDGSDFTFKAESEPFALSWQRWKGQSVVRTGPSRQVWHLTVGGLPGWKLQRDPLAGDEVTAVEKPKANSALFELEGDVEPGKELGGEVLNDTKATPSEISIVDEGRAEIIDRKPGLIRLRFRGKKLQGIYTLEAEEKGSEIWTFAKDAEAEKREEDDPWKTGDVELADIEDTEKAIPVRGGVQIWDPEKKDPNVDREQLEPLAIFSPMKPAKRFDDTAAAVKEWGHGAAIEHGVFVEPKENGFRFSVQKKGDQVFSFTEDEKRDLLPLLPTVREALERIPGEWILDTEFMEEEEGGGFVPRRDLARFRGKEPQDDKRVRLKVVDLLYHNGRNLLGRPYHERRSALRRFFDGKKTLGPLVITPTKLAKSAEQLQRAIAWARKVPGSEGAMLKLYGSTYSLGGENSAWAKIKDSREIRAIVYERHPVKDSPGVYNFFGAVGPVREDEWNETVEVGGKTYTPVGRTFNSKEEAEVGDVIRVEATEILVDASGDKKSLRWFTPTVIERVDTRPMTAADVVRLAKPEEIKKIADAILQREIPIFKADEERLVYGEVLIPEEVDAQKEIYSEEEVRQAAHGFMENFQNLGVMHKELANGRLKILESFIAPVEMEIAGKKIKKGTWLLAVRVISDKLWKQVKDGKWTGFSIGGSAVRVAETSAT